MSVLSSGFGFLIGLLKVALMTGLLLVGLLLGLLITIKVLLVFALIKIWRTFHSTPPATKRRGQVFDGDYHVVSPQAGRATVLMVAGSKTSQTLSDA